MRQNFLPFALFQTIQDGTVHYSQTALSVLLQVLSQILSQAFFRSERQFQNHFSNATTRL
jgi:hypothetical protein